MSDPVSLGLLALWATAAGLDLASVLQGLLNRPLVAGAVAGIILGDPLAGLRIGAVLELFALEVLPVGASRYPDYGAATVAAVTFGAGRPWDLTLGPCVVLGLVLGAIGGNALVLHRRIVAALLRRSGDALDAGEPGAAESLHRMGLVGDTVRSALLAVAGLAAAAALGSAPQLDVETGHVLALVVTAGGLCAAVGGAVRRAGSVRHLVWLGLGGVVGMVVVGVR